MRDFKQNGLLLAPEKREQLKSLRKRMSDNMINFQQNLNEDQTALFFTREELDGLPQDFIDGLQKRTDGEVTKYRVSLQYPELLPVMRYARIEETRRQMDLANASKCMQLNTPLLEETVALRQEAAQLLGYPDHASFILEDRMAKNPSSVLEFIQQLSEKLEPLARKEWEKMVALKKAITNYQGATTIHSHDFPFYHQRILEAEYEVDQNLTKEYFPFETVTRGMLEVYQDLFSLRFEEATDAPTWHPDVRMFDVYDRSSNAFMGQFYLDLWPREGKYSHAAVFPLIPSHHFPQNSEVLALPDIPTSFSSNLHPVSDGESRQGKMLKQAPVAAMVANFTKPRADRPSLLTHDEVETYFHEFGHVMHNICTSAKYARFSGTSVERDFVEAPSQVATSFCHVKSLRTYFSGPHSRCWRIGAMRRKC